MVEEPIAAIHSDDEGNALQGGIIDPGYQDPAQIARFVLGMSFNSALMSEREIPKASSAEFDQLQKKLVPLWKSIESFNQDPQTIVVVPSMSVDQEAGSEAQ